MKTDQRLLPWIYHLLRKSHVEYLAQRSQIEEMLEEGALLAPLFFQRNGSTSVAESFLACSADDSDERTIFRECGPDAAPDHQ